MLLRNLRPPPAGGREEAAALRRGLTAMLRWRLRVLAGLVPARAVEAVRLVPVLLHASFERPTLRSDAPGVTGLRYRRSWTALARRFELPPPCRAQRGSPLVEAVLALPAGERLEAVVVAAPGLRPSDLRWVEERAAAAREALAAAGARLALTVVDPAGLARDGRLGHRAAAYGALVGGTLSPAAWATFEAAARRPVEPHGLAALAADAPTALAALALTLISDAPAPAPLHVAARLLGAGVRARTLAHPDELGVRWASKARPEHAAALQGVRQHARGAAAGPGAPDAAPAEADALVTLGRGLALASARAIRGARSARLAPDDRALWRERVGADLPHALLPVLGDRLAAAGPLRTTLARAGAAHEVRLPGGAVLGRGATPVQARVRALSVLASAALEPLLDHAEPPWRSVAARLAQRRERPTLILVVEPSGPSGPPFDPLNRGPERAIGFPGALAVRLAPGRRPTARVLGGEEAVDRLVREVRRGTAVEVLPARSEAHPVAARLAQLAALVRDAGGATPVAVEAGGRVIFLTGRRAARFPLARFAVRPRIFVPDPDAPDLALSPGERRPAGLGGPAVIECRAALLDDRRAAVLYADARGGHLREVVFLWELEDHLREARAVLQAADPAALLAVRLSPDLEPALRRAGRPPAPVKVSVRGHLPFDLQVEVGGAWYGGASGRSWRDAARALLVAWPREDARIAVDAVTALAQGRRRGGLLALWARGVAVRRLRLHLVRTLQAYHSGRMRRRGG